MLRKIKKSVSGFTLVELAIIIVILGIVAAVAIPKFGTLTENSKINATKDEIGRLKSAIIGDPRIVSGGEYVNRGFEGDVGYPPARLQDLVQKPDSVPPYNKFTRIGWNGPYLNATEQHYLFDAWSKPYVYDPSARTITSTSVTPNITTSF